MAPAAAGVAAPLVLQQGTTINNKSEISSKEKDNHVEFNHADLVPPFLAALAANRRSDVLDRNNNTRHVTTATPVTGTLGTITTKQCFKKKRPGAGAAAAAIAAAAAAALSPAAAVLRQTLLGKEKEKKQLQQQRPQKKAICLQSDTAVSTSNTEEEESESRTAHLDLVLKRRLEEADAISKALQISGSQQQQRKQERKKSAQLPKEQQTPQERVVKSQPSRIEEQQPKSEQLESIEKQLQQKNKKQKRLIRDEALSLQQLTEQRSVETQEGGIRDQSQYVDVEAFPAAKGEHSKSRKGHATHCQQRQQQPPQRHRKAEEQKGKRKGTEEVSAFLRKKAPVTCHMKSVALASEGQGKKQLRTGAASSAKLGEHIRKMGFHGHVEPKKHVLRTQQCGDARTQLPRKNRRKQLEAHRRISAAGAVSALHNSSGSEQSAKTSSSCTFNGKTLKQPARYFLDATVQDVIASDAAAAADVSAGVAAGFTAAVEASSEVSEAAQGSRPKWESVIYHTQNGRSIKVQRLREAAATATTGVPAAVAAETEGNTKKYWGKDCQENVLKIRRTKTRSRQKNLRRDKRPDHLKPVHLQKSITAGG